MMKIPRLEEDKNIEENIIKDVRNLFRLKNFKKEPNDTAIKDISLDWKKKRNQLKIKFLEMLEILLDMKKKEKIIINQPIRVSNFWSNKYIEYESKDDRNKTLSVRNYLNKIRPYTWKIS